MARVTYSVSYVVVGLSVRSYMARGFSTYRRQPLNPTPLDSTQPDQHQRHHPTRERQEEKEYHEQRLASALWQRDEEWVAKAEAEEREMDEAYEANLAQQLDHAREAHAAEMGAKLAQVEADAAADKERSVQEVIQQSEDRCVALVLRRSTRAADCHCTCRTEHASTCHLYERAEIEAISDSS